MCEYLEYDVVRLNRVRLMHLHLGDLPLGQWRDLTQKEVNDLKATIADSDNSPFADHDAD